MVLVIYKVYQRMEAEEMLPNSFYVASFTLILKPSKDITRKGN